MHFYTYYLEIKNRIMLLALLWGTVFFVSYFFKEVLINIIFGSFSLKLFSFIFTDVTEVFFVYISLGCFFSNQALMLYLFYYLLLFFLPGLTKSEASFFIFVFLTSSLSAFFSILFFNKVLFPISLNFFLSFQSLETLKSFSLEFEAKLIEYCSFYLKFYGTCVLYFQFFLVPVFLFRYVKNELRLYSRYRKPSYYFCVIFSTMVTPPDVVSQVILSFSIIVCCEVLVYSSIILKVLK